MLKSKESYYRYWGKAKSETTDGEPEYHLLVYHCLDVAAVGKIILDKNPNLHKRLSIISKIEENLLKTVLLFFLAIHDIGKFSESFQFIFPNLCKKLLGVARSDKQPYSKKFGHDSMGFLLWKKFIFKQLMNLIKEKIGENFDTEDWGDIIIWFGESACGHHGLPAIIANNSLESYFSDTDKQAAMDYVEDLLKFFPIQDLFAIDIEKKYDILLKNLCEASWGFAGFIVMCDWIGSGETFKYHSNEHSLNDYWNTIALKRAEKAVEQAGILPCKSNRELNPLTELLNLPKNVQLTSLQELVKNIPLTDEPQLFIIEDATGAGKTEASLILLNRLMALGVANGFFLALPTMSTADGIFPRIQKPYKNLYHPDEKPSLILSHSLAKLSKKINETIIYSSFIGKRQIYEDDAEFRCQSWLTDNRKKSLLAHAGVGTIDQAFLSVLKAKYQSLRLIGLVGKILIVDEAHAYDAYMNKELEVLLQVHAALGGSAIVMSATLPFDTRQKLSDAFLKGLGKGSFDLSEKQAYPLLTHVSSESKINSEKPFSPKNQMHDKERQIQFLHKEEEIDNVIMKSIQAGKCVCWIRNSVRDARQSFQRLSAIHQNVELFHARFTIADRLTIQNGVMACFNRGRGNQSDQRKSRLLIATQVVEQSLDLDFDVIISDLAPIDLLLQRIGRMHRHIRDKFGNPKDKGPDERDTAIFYVYTPEYMDNPGDNWFTSHFPNAKKVYENHARLWLGLKQLDKLSDGKLPKNIRSLIEETYNKEAEIPTGLQNTDIKAEGNKSSHRTIGAFNTIEYETGYSMEGQIWPEDLNMPTRLGEETIIITLAKWQNGKLSPFNETEKQPWQNSEIRVLKKNISKLPEYNDAVQNAFDKIKPTLPGQGKWINLLPVVFNTEKKCGNRILLLTEAEVKRFTITISKA